MYSRLNPYWLLLIVFCSETTSADITVDTTLGRIEGVGTTRRYGVQYHRAGDDGGTALRATHADVIDKQWTSLGYSRFFKRGAGWIVGFAIDAGPGRDLERSRNFLFADGSVFVTRILAPKWSLGATVRHIVLDELDTTLFTTTLGWHPGLWSVEPNLQVSMGDTATRTINLRVTRHNRLRPYGGVVYGDVAADLADLDGHQATRQRQLYFGLSIPLGRYRIGLGFDVGGIGEADRASVSVALTRHAP